MISIIRRYRKERKYRGVMNIFKYKKIPLFAIAGYCITKIKNIYAVSQVTDKRPINNPIQGRCY